MPREAALPTPWRCLEGRVHYVQQVSNTEYSASCPECGGTPHEDGEWPDRLRIFVDDKPIIWCRRCDLKAFPDQFGDGTYARPTKEELEAWRVAQERREQERKRSAERALAHLEEGRFWERYHQAMGIRDRNFWRVRGIPDRFQEWWKLGAASVQVPVDGEWKPWPTASIPLFGPEFAIRNVKHRLVEPPDGVGKYRYEIKGQSAPLFLTNPELDLGEHVYAVEGEIKSMVTWIRYGDRHARIVGLPGTQTSDESLAPLADAGRITLVMDPGAKRQAVALARKLGITRCWVLVPSMKIDDGILAADMDAPTVRRLLNTAIRLSDYVVAKGRAQ